MWSIFSRDPIKDFPFEVGEKVPGLEDQSIWTLHAGKRKANGEPVSIFLFDAASDGNDSVKQVAVASIKRLKTLRHPNVLSFIDSLETPKAIYIVTEPVTPLSQHLKSIGKESSRELAISWGLHQISKGLGFLVNTVNLIHNNVCMSSIFVDQSGEWKLGGVDYMYPASGDGSNLPPFKTLPILEKYDPPEKSAKGRSHKSSKWSCDMWGLGCLIWEVFNGPLPRTSSLKVVGKIPKSLIPHYCELVGANPASRPSPETFIENCRNDHCFMNNHFVETNLFLEEFQIKDQDVKNEFFNELPKHLDDFPTEYSKHKILPQLLNAFQFGNAGSAVLPPLFKLGSLLDADEYQSKIVPCIVKLFSSTDRATRIHLLRQLSLFIEHLKPQIINTQIFPNIVTGFMDTNPAIREQSIKVDKLVLGNVGRLDKAMLLLAPKLNENNLNNELMKHFARLQSRDDQGPIRTNTTVCLGKIACHLNAVTRQKVLSSAFTRAMRDPFPAARTSGVLAMSANVQYFNTKDCAYKVLPALVALTVDPDKNVRDHCFTTISTFLERLQQASNDPEYAVKMDSEAATAAPATTTNASSGSGWTGWMSTGVSSITSRLYKKDQEASKSTGDSPQQEEVHPDGPSAQNQQEVTKKVTKVEIEDDDDASDYGDENEDQDGENQGWDDLEEFRSPITPMPTKSRNGSSSAQREIVTVSKLRALEEDIWSDLKLKVKIEDEKEEGGDWQDDDTGWDNSGWDDVGPGASSKKPSKTTPKRNVNTRNQKTAKAKSGWDDGGGWDDWENESFENTAKDVKESDVIPASSYQWSGDNTNPDSDEFFSNITKTAKPSKKLTQPARKLQSSQSARKSDKKDVTPEHEKNKAEENWGWNDDWNEPSQGLSKSEQMKIQREERKRQRQEELQKKRAVRAAGGGGKLGARKMD